MAKINQRRTRRDRAGDRWRLAHFPEPSCSTAGGYFETCRTMPLPRSRRAFAVIGSKWNTSRRSRRPSPKSQQYIRARRLRGPSYRPLCRSFACRPIRLLTVHGNPAIVSDPRNCFRQRRCRAGRRVPSVPFRVIGQSENRARTRSRGRRPNHRLSTFDGQLPSQVTAKTAQAGGGRKRRVRILHVTDDRRPAKADQCRATTAMPRCW